MPTSPTSTHFLGLARPAPVFTAPRAAVGEGLGGPGLGIDPAQRLAYSSLLTCDFTWMRLTRETFSAVERMDDVNLAHSRGDDLVFAGKILSTVRFRNATYMYPSFRDAVLGCCDFTDAVMRDADFSGVAAAGTIRDPERTGGSPRFFSVFRRATLPGFTAVEAGLDEADFSDADLTNAIFTGASLCRANFSGADLSGARWNGADLRGADLRDTRGLTGDALRLAVLDETTQLPAGLAGPAVIDLRTTPGILTAHGR